MATELEKQQSGLRFETIDKTLTRDEINRRLRLVMSNSMNMRVIREDILGEGESNNLRAQMKMHTGKVDSIHL